MNEKMNVFIITHEHIATNTVTETIKIQNHPYPIHRGVFSSRKTAEAFLLQEIKYVTEAGFPFPEKDSFLIAEEVVDSNPVAVPNSWRYNHLGECIGDYPPPLTKRDLQKTLVSLDVRLSKGMDQKSYDEMKSQIEEMMVHAAP